MSLKDILDKKIKEVEVDFYDTIVEVHDMMTKRIFTDNLDANGNKSKPYSTDPVWLSQKSVPRASGVKNPKTYYYEGGYSQMKREIGRPPLELFGNLKKDFATGLREIGENQYAIIVTEESANKLEGNFPSFAKVSDKERKFIKESLGNK